MTKVKMVLANWGPRKWEYTLIPVTKRFKWMVGSDGFYAAKSLATSQGKGMAKRHNMEVVSIEEAE